MEDVGNPVVYRFSSWPGRWHETYDGYTVNKIDICLLCLVNSNLTWFRQWVDFRAYWEKKSYNFVHIYTHARPIHKLSCTSVPCYIHIHIHMYFFLSPSLSRWMIRMRLIGKLPFLYYHNLCGWLSHCQLHRDVKTNAILRLIMKIAIFNNF